MDDSGAPDATLQVLAKVSSLIEVLQLCGPYELVYQLWSQFTLTASRMNIDMTWCCDEVLVGNFLLHVSTYLCALAYCCCVLVDHFERDVPPQPFSCVRLSEGAWAEQHRVRRAQLGNLCDGADVGKVHISSCLCCGVEPIQRQYHPGAYDSGKNSGCCRSRCICCVSAWMSACSGRSFCKLSGKWVPCQASGLPHVCNPVAEALPPLDCCICVWEPGAVLNDGIRGKPFERSRGSGMDCVLSRIPKGHHYERHLHLVAIIVGVWPLVVSYLKEIGRKDVGDSLVVRFSTVGDFFCVIWMYSSLLCCLEDVDGQVSVPRSTCLHEIQSVSSSSGNL